MYTCLKKVKWALLLMCAIVFQTQATPIQWKIEDGGNGHWYQFIDCLVTWNEANFLASGSTFMSVSGHLATITSAEENAFIFDSVASGNNAWIGLSDAETEGVFTWVTGEPLDYTNWFTGEPNNDAILGENFGEFKADGSWNDWNSVAETSYIVEYSTSVPAPPGIVLFGIAFAGLVLQRKGVIFKPE